MQAIDVVESAKLDGEELSYFYYVYYEVGQSKLK
jgi:hypothetical protein